VLHARDLHTNLFELQSKDAEARSQVPVMASVDAAAVRIVVCDDEAQAPKHTSHRFRTMLVFILRTMKSLRRAQRWCEPDGHGIDERDPTRVVDGDRDP
jgi:hypothetical protein